MRDGKKGDVRELGKAEDLAARTGKDG